MNRITILAAALVATFGAQAAPHTPVPIDGITPIPDTVHVTKTLEGQPATEMLWNKSAGKGQVLRVRATVTGCNEGYGTVVLSSDVSNRLDWAVKGGTKGDAVAAETCRYGFDLTEAGAK